MVTGLRTSGVENAFYALVLLAISLNRFLLAVPSASLPHTIDSSEYMVANSVVPTVGPAGVLLGAGVPPPCACSRDSHALTAVANAILFVVAAAGFGQRGACATDPRHQLGQMLWIPSRRAMSSPLWRPSGTWRSADRPPSVCSPSERIALIYGIVTVATILVYRNYFHRIEEVEAAIADLGVLLLVTGAGFVLAAAVTPPMTPGSAFGGG